MYVHLEEHIPVQIWFGEKVICNIKKKDLKKSVQCKEVSGHACQIQKWRNGVPNQFEIMGVFLN